MATEGAQVTGRQLAAGRALVGLSQGETARQANISVATLRRFESAAGPVEGMANNVAAVVRALEAAGVEFISGGVRVVQRHDGEVRSTTASPPRRR